MAWSAAIPITHNSGSMGIAALHPSYSSIIPATASSCSRASSLLRRAPASQGRVQLHVPRTGPFAADRAGTLNRRMAWSAAIPINSCTDSMGIATLHPSYSSIIRAAGSSCSRASSLLPRATASRGRVQSHVPRTGPHVADRAGTLNVGWRGAQRYPSSAARAAWVSLRSTHPTHPLFQPLPAPVREQARSYEEPIGTDR